MTLLKFKFQKTVNEFNFVSDSKYQNLLKSSTQSHFNELFKSHITKRTIFPFNVTLASHKPHQPLENVPVQNHFFD